MPASHASDPAERLRSLLGADPPAGVLALDEHDQRALAELLADSRRRQSASLEASFEKTLRHVPFPVRAIVKKVLLA